MSFLGDIDTIRKEFFKEKFVAELKQLEDDLEFMMASESSESSEVDEEEGEQEGSKNWVEERINNLKLIVSALDGDILEGKKDYKEKHKTLQDDLDEMSSYIYKMAWNRLPIYHKTVKIREFTKELVQDQKVRKELTEELIDLVNKKKINTKKFVNYDSLNCKITEINILKYDPETNEYELN